MPYIGNTIRAADDYRLIDDISSGFNGSETSFALQVAGSAPVPFPKSPQQVLISVNGVIQEPDPTGSSGFNLVGTNIVFSSAPTNGHAFFGIIYATADYLNAGGNFPAGSLGAPSITFIGDENSGLYRKGGGSVGFVSDATEIANFDSNGITISSGNLIIPDSIIHNGDSDTKIRFGAANEFSVETAGVERFEITPTEVTFNDTGADVDFRIEGDSVANLFKIDASVDNIGIGMAAPKFSSGNGIELADNFFLGFGSGNGTRPDFQFGTTAGATLDIRCGTGSDLVDMVINTSGHLGIGTTSPSTPLHVVGTIHGSTNIGIRTTSPQNNLHVHQDDSDKSIAQFTNTTTGNASGDGFQIGLSSSEQGLINMKESASILFKTADSDAMTIDSSQRVGIGTTTPSTLLELSGGGNTVLTINTGNNSGDNSQLAFADSADGNIGFINYDHGTNEMAFKVNGGTAVTITSARDFCVGTSTAVGKAQIGTDASEVGLTVSNSSHDSNLQILATASNKNSNIFFGDNADGNVGAIDYDHNDNSLSFKVNGGERSRFNNGGDFLIGTTSDTILASFGTNTGGILVDNVGSSNTAVGVSHDTTELFLGADTDTGYIWQASNHKLQIATNDTRRVIITAGGQMGLGEVTETAIRNNGAGNKTYLVISKGNGSGSAPTAYNADEEYLHLGGREYSDGSGDLGQYFIGFGYTNGVAGDHSPCAIGMNTTSESGYTKGNFVIRTRSGTNQNSTTGERLTIQSNGNVTTVVGGFVDRTNAGFTARKNDSVSMTRDSGTPVEINRESNDGGLIFFYQDNSAEGTINVSGSTVSYNGGHLSRWSQLDGISKTDKSARPTIYQGTVMSNLDELCTWEHADELWTEQHKDDGVLPADKNVGDVKRPAYTEINQQLNMTKVSDTEGDKDVAGVFWTWDDDDDEIVNDFYIAMTGDMVIRVAGSTTVQRGDLLISAGDGTAKPQADDIIRSSTIAKIISTNSTATYPDGSKAYPCVLMAC